MADPANTTQPTQAPQSTQTQPPMQSTQTSPSARSTQTSPPTGTKRGLLDRWCDNAWLICVYALALIMLIVLIVNWGQWETPQRIAAMLMIAVALHIFEENTWPGGFFYMNNVGFGSTSPLVYPQNRATNMVTNLGAEIVFIVLTIFAPALGPIVVMAAILFGIAECFNHTRGGIIMLRRLRDQGKKTIYGPGIVTAYLALLPISIWGIVWMTSASFTGWDIVLGICVVLGIVICLILIPFIVNIRVKSATFAFRNARYFARYAEEPIGNES